MPRLCDLHTHSNCSDGTLTPAELITEACRAGLSAIALCDHNTVAGLPAFLEVAKGKPIEAVPGIEFSTDYLGTELHILGLFIRPEHYTPITRRMEGFLRDKERSNLALIDALAADGYRLDYARIRAATPNGLVNRAHIAEELTRLGYTGSVKEAFKTLLAPEKGYYCPPKRLDVMEAISWIRDMGAIAVLAHPFLNLDETALLEFLPQAKKQGLSAMETMYTKYTPETTRAACRIADSMGLLHSGGSDFHGSVKPDTALGTGRGDLAIPIEILHKLKQAL